MKTLTLSELRDIYNGERGAEKLIEMLGCSRPTLYRLLKKHDIPLKHPEKSSSNRIIITQE